MNAVLRTRLTGREGKWAGRGPKAPVLGVKAAGAVGTLDTFLAMVRGRANR
jgi:hypothetical protein